jgi:hypothetical protein
MSHRHEQKHLLHNWSDRRYRDHPQSPRAVLRVRLDSGAIATKRTIFVAVMAPRGPKRFVARADEKPRAFLELERLGDESFRALFSWAERRVPFFLLLPSFDDLLMLVFF